MYLTTLTTTKYKYFKYFKVMWLTNVIWFNIHKYSNYSTTFSITIYSKNLPATQFF